MAVRTQSTSLLTPRFGESRSGEQITREQSSQKLNQWLPDDSIQQLRPEQGPIVDMSHTVQHTVRHRVHLAHKRVSAQQRLLDIQVVQALLGHLKRGEALGLVGLEYQLHTRETMRPNIIQMSAYRSIDARRLAHINFTVHL